MNCANVIGKKLTLFFKYLNLECNAMNSQNIFIIYCDALLFIVFFNSNSYFFNIKSLLKNQFISAIILHFTHQNLWLKYVDFESDYTIDWMVMCQRTSLAAYRNRVSIKMSDVAVYCTFWSPDWKALWAKSLKPHRFSDKHT